MREQCGRHVTCMMHALSASAACAVLAACIQRPPGIVTSEATRVEHRAADAIGGPHVPAGTPLEVVTVDALGTTVAAKGAPFEAVVTHDMTDADGDLVVRSGALVRGKVSRTSEEEAPPVLVIDVESIETVRGTAPLEATLRSAEHHVTFPDESGEIVIPPGSQLRFVLTRPVVLSAR